MARLTAVALCALVIASVAEASPVRTCPSICFCRHITPTVKKADCRDIPEWDLKASDAQVVRIIPPLHPVPSAPLFLSRLDMFPKVQMFSVTNRSIVEVVSGYSATLQVLDLSHNKISRFNERTFSHMPVLRQLNLAGNPIALKKGIRLLVSSSLRTLVLGYTGLTHIPNGSLSGIPHLTSLYLQGNPIEMQEGFPLVDRVSIQELDLSYCKLTKIPYHSLANLVNLQRLYLKGNDLKTIFPGALPSSIHHLDLSANRFRDVPMTALSALKNLTNLELAKNPVKCTCDVINFLDRLSEHNVIFEKMIVCAEPEKYAKIPWKSIDERELCKDDLTSEESSDDSQSTSMSFERDDVSYETDGPPEEENRILTQHPPPLSLQKLLQNASKYQNMEENSIQSDQPYSDTSDEGMDHITTDDATTVETLVEKVDDDLIVAENTSTESFDVSEEKHDVGNGISKRKDDSLVVPVVPDDTSKISGSAESHEKPLQDTEEINFPAEPDTRETKSTPRDRERMEDEDEQKADLIKAPNASLEYDGQTETPVRISEDSTENPDSETFMRNEETIAMGKLMPESKVSDKSEKVDPPLILASQSEGQPGIQKKDEPFLQLEDQESHPSSTAEPSNENPLSDEEDLRPTSVGVPSTSEADEIVETTTAATAEPMHLGNKESEISSSMTSEEPSSSPTTAHPEISGRESTVESVTLHPIHVTTDSEEALQRTSVAMPLEVTESVDEHTEVTKSQVSSAENNLENGSSKETTPAESAPEIPKSLESSAETNFETGSSQEATPAETLHYSGETGEDAITHSYNHTVPLTAQTESDLLDSESTGLSENDRSKLDKFEMQHEVTRNNEGEIETTELGISSPTPDPSLSHDKDVFNSSSLFDDVDAQIASIFPETTIERIERPAETTTAIVETTTARVETTTARVETTTSSGFIFFPFNFFTKSTEATIERIERPAETTTARVETTTTARVETTTNQKESSNGFMFFPFNFLPKSTEDKPPPTVSEPDSFPPTAVSEPEGFPPTVVSDPVDFPAQTSHSQDLRVENNEARVSDSDDVVADEGDAQTAIMAYAMIAGLIVCIIIAVACVSLRTRSDKTRKGSAPVRIRGDNVSPGTEMKDMMNPLLEPVVEGQTANEFLDDPSRLSSLELNGQNGKFPMVSPVSKENGVMNGNPPQGPVVDDITHVVIEAPPSLQQPTQNGVSSGPVNEKPPRQNGTTPHKVKVVAGVIPPAIPRTPVYVEKINGKS